MNDLDAMTIVLIMDTQFTDFSPPDPDAYYYCNSKSSNVTSTNFTTLMKLTLYKSINLSDAKMFKNIRPMIIDIVNKNPAELNKKNSIGYTALIIAYDNVETYSSIKCIKLLLELGADVNIRADSMRTVLHKARTNLSIDFLKLFIEFKANVNLQTFGEDTALMLVCYHSLTLAYESSIILECIQTLLDANTDVNILDNFNMNALMIFCINCKQLDVELSLKCIELLINAGSDINTRDCNGDTALMHYCMFQHDAINTIIYDVRIIDLLINSGADVNSQNNCGDNALMIYCETCVFDESSLDILLLLIRNTTNVTRINHSKSARSYFINNPTCESINNKYIESLLSGKEMIVDIKSAKKI